ncbi:MAG: hypothetical protein PHT07_14815 [Paludibacter sp.]|nr:hypothetical protein [Paludibacter sp.]
MEFPKYKPGNNQECLVRCREFSEVGYEVCMFENGQFIRGPNGDITQYVTEWIPLKRVIKLF